MAWRIADYIERGEIDNRIRDRVTGVLYLCEGTSPIRLELTGNPHRDLAGQYLRFINPNPKPLPEQMQRFAVEQTGVVGDMTAARKVKVLDIPDDEFEHYYRNRIPMPYHWGNAIYLEWHSVRNGRVVIEATEFLLEVEPEAAWQMTEAEANAQVEANARAMTSFMGQLLEAAAQAEEDEEPPTSEAEAAADAEAARMDLLMDRVTARLDREKNPDSETFSRIMEEERERLRKERGEPEPEPLTPEEEAEREEWVAEMNAAAEEALNEEPDPEERRKDPFVEHCQTLGSRIHQAIKENGWLPEGAPEEHPLNELKYGVWFAAAKLAGALNGYRREWPPNALFAGDCLVRLKKARHHLKDAQLALESIEAEKLTDPGWCPPLRQELQGIARTVQSKIEEVRRVLEESDEVF